MADDRIIADENDFVMIAGPIKGLDPDTGSKVTFHGTGVVAFITDEEDSDTPLGTLTYNSNEIGTSGKYPMAFNAGDISSSLAAIDDGTIVYAVLHAADDFRRVVPLTYKKVLEAD